MLIVFGGLPGSGKTTLAREIARMREATYLRIDVIEQALRASATLAGNVGPAGYLIAYAIAENNLRPGHVVVADFVNPLTITRQAWRHVAETTGSDIREVEVVCSDPVEHRRRVATRTVDVSDLILPTWQNVVDREYDPWDRPRIVIDTAHRSISDALEELSARLDDVGR